MSTAKSRGPRRALRIGLQFLGFALGLALLAWCVSGALSEANREQLRRLSNAPLWVIAGLVALSAASLVCNGTVFWCALRPVKHIGFIDMQATNAVGTFLAYLPFKLSVVFRVLIHTRRDGVPLLLVGGWFAAVAIGIAAAAAPPLVASVVLPRVDLLYGAIVLAGLVVSHLAVSGLASAFAGERGLLRVQGLAERLTPRFVQRFTRSRAFGHLHAAFDMLAHPWYLAAQMGLRVLDLALLSARLLLAAWVLDVNVDAGQSVVYASVHFALGALSPTGALGTREGGTAGLATVFDPQLAEQLKLVLLLVLAVESAVMLFAAAAGLLRLRPDRLLRRPLTNSDTSGESASIRAE